MPDPMNDMAFAETLKLMFNINHFYPDICESFLKSITPLLKILHRTRIPTPALQPPINYIINALTNLDLENKKCLQFGGSHPFFPSFDKKCNAEHLINILERTIQDYKEPELDNTAAPIISLIRKVYEVAPESVKKFMECLLLPSNDERSQPLGKSDTLASKLLQLSTSSSLPTVRTSISAMMFELSGKDAQKFVKNVGYGFAAGFLMNNGMKTMEIPTNASEAFSNGGAGERASTSSEGSSVPVNPITGQRLDAEPKVENGPAMTEEEKEQEAERLFVLFERYVQRLLVMMMLTYSIADSEQTASSAWRIRFELQSSRDASKNCPTRCQDHVSVQLSRFTL